MHEPAAASGPGTLVLSREAAWEFSVLSPSARAAVRQALSVRLAPRTQRRFVQDRESVWAGDGNCGAYCSPCLISTGKRPARRGPSLLKIRGPGLHPINPAVHFPPGYWAGREECERSNPAKTRKSQFALRTTDSHFPPGKFPYLETEASPATNPTAHLAGILAEQPQLARMHQHLFMLREAVKQIP